MGLLDSIKDLYEAGAGALAAPKASDRVKAFLSCSVRPQDQPLVDAIQSVLSRRGFDCRTVGRNFSRAEQVDDAVKSLVNECECLIGVATERFEAIDRTTANQTLRLATPYVLQETSMAFQAGMPWFMFKTPGLTLQGVTNRNLWIEVQRDLSDAGRPRFKCSPAALDAVLDDLKQKAIGYRKRRQRAALVATLTKGVSVVAGGATAVWAVSRAARPECFGNYYYRDRTCKGCSYKPDCKAEKNRS